MATVEPVIHRGELTELVRILDEGTGEEKCRALTLLCPCRNRVYNIEVWRRIFQVAGSEDGGVRHRAVHAIGTLKQRAAQDPRSWELLMQLERETGQDMQTGVLSVALWGPRNRPSRRKRMTVCRTGRWKALASMQFVAMRPPPEPSVEPG